MQTIFEVFDPVTGTTEGYKTLEGAKSFCDRMERAGFVRDYLPSSGEGFWVVDMRGSVKGSNRDRREEAENTADMLNMGSDTNHYSVVEHSL